MLLDDARRFAAAAAAAGVDVTLDLYEGMPHAFHLTVLFDTPLPAPAPFLRRLGEWANRVPAR